MFLEKYTTPKITSTKNGRRYIYFRDCLTGEKFRIYSGKQFGFPSTKSLNKKQLDSYFTQLLVTVHQKLSEGWLPSSRLKCNLNPTTTNVTDDLKAFIKAKRYSTSHQKAYFWYWGVICNEFPNQPISSIKQPELLELIIRRHNTSGATYNTAIAYYRGLYSLLIQMGLTQENPIVGIKKQRHTPVNHALLKQQELNFLFEFLKLHHMKLYLMSMFVYYCYLRPHKEVRLLKWDFFNEDLTKLTIPNGYTKNQMGRTIELTHELTKVLIKHKECRNSLYVFGTINPFYFKTAWKRFVRDKNILNQHQTIYSLRHTAISQLYKSTKDIWYVKQLIGHSSVTSTERYLRGLSQF